MELKTERQDTYSNNSETRGFVHRTTDCMLCGHSDWQFVLTDKRIWWVASPGFSLKSPPSGCLHFLPLLVVPVVQEDSVLATLTAVIGKS